MATNGTIVAAHSGPEEGDALGALDKAPLRKSGFENRGPEYPRSADPAGAVETGEDFALAPLVDKIAYGIARGLIVAVKELEHHIGSETRKVGEIIDRRLDTFHAKWQDLSDFVGEQRSTNHAVQDQLNLLTAEGVALRETDARQAAGLDALGAEAHKLSESVLQKIDVSTASLQESDARQASELEALRTETGALSSSISQRIDVTTAALNEANAVHAADLAALQGETRAFSKSASERIDALGQEFGVQQEDIQAIKATLCNFSARVDAAMERLDRQADAVRSMCSAYSQRETELEQLVAGLARLRAYPTPTPAGL
jgi:chromosome segregation ATPase